MEAPPRHAALSHELLPDAPVFLRVEGKSSTSLAVRVGVSSFHSAERPQEVELSWRRQTTTSRAACSNESEPWQSELLCLADVSTRNAADSAPADADDEADGYGDDDDGETVPAGAGGAPSTIAIDHMLCSLERDTVYELSARARNAAGWSAASASEPSVVGRTLLGIEPPAPPTIVKVEVVSSRDGADGSAALLVTLGLPPLDAPLEEVHLRLWRLPSEDNAHAPAPKSTQSCAGSRSGADLQEEVRGAIGAGKHCRFLKVNFASDGAHESHVVCRLDVVPMGCRYEVEVRARNEAGAGQFSLPRRVQVRGFALWQCPVCRRPQPILEAHCSTCGAARAYDAQRLENKYLATPAIASLCSELAANEPRATAELVFDLYAPEGGGPTRANAPGGGRFDDSDAGLLAEALAQNHTVTALRITHNARRPDPDPKSDSGMCGLSARGVQQLVAAMPESDGWQPALTLLDLSANNLGSDAAGIIGEALAANSSLTSLALNDNPLGDNGCCRLARALLRHSSLTQLALASCDLNCRAAAALATALDAHSCIIDLDVDANFKGCADESVEQLSAAQVALDKLSLRGVELTDASLFSLSRRAGTGWPASYLMLGISETAAIGSDGVFAMARACASSSCSLHRVEFTILEPPLPDAKTVSILPCQSRCRDIGQVFTLLPKLATLTHIALGSARVGDCAVVALCHALRCLGGRSKLRALDLTNNMLTDALAHELAALIRAVRVKKLLLCANRFGAATARQLAATMLSHDVDPLEKASYRSGSVSSAATGTVVNPCQVHSICLDRNKLGESGGQVLLDLLRRAPSLTWLDCRGCAPPVPGFLLESIDALLQLQPTVERMQEGTPLDDDARLRLDALNLRAGGVSELLRVFRLAKLNMLRVLELPANDLKDEGAALMANALRDQPCMYSLRTLALDRNNIKCRGAAALATTLSHDGGAMLSALYVADNPIGDAGGAALALALPISRLKVLDMHCTQLSDRSAQHFKLAVRRCNQLNRINLRDTLVSSPLVESIESIVAGAVRVRMSHGRERGNVLPPIKVGVSIGVGSHAAAAAGLASAAALASAADAITAARRARAVCVALARVHARAPRSSLRRSKKAKARARVPQTKAVYAAQLARPAMKAKHKRATRQHRPLHTKLPALPAASMPANARNGIARRQLLEAGAIALWGRH